MGLLNWFMHRSIRRSAEQLVAWASETYTVLHAQNPGMAEREVFGKLLEQRFRFPGGDRDSNSALDKFGSSMHGICYYAGLNTAQMKGMMVIRCVQFTEYVDIELKKRGFNPPPLGVKRDYFEVLGLPEDALHESYL
jgi:hypothetical protein